VTDICVDEPLEDLQDLHENCIPKWNMWAFS
jgi:hypothetical protein